LEKNVIIRVPALVNKKANSIGLRAIAFQETHSVEREIGISSKPRA
jgi:hypothetical protein